MTNAHPAYLPVLLLMLLLLANCGGAGEAPRVSEEVHGSVSDIIPRLQMERGSHYLLQPAGHPEDSLKIPENLEKEAIRSYVFVRPGVSTMQISRFQPGKVLAISLDDGLDIRVRINRNQAIGQRIRNLTGTIAEPHSGILTLSVTDSSMTGNIDLLSESKLYYIRYDSKSGLHYLAEIDRDKLDVLKGSEPLKY